MEPAVAKIDALRYESPRRALEEALRQRQETPDDPWLCAVIGSCYRMLSKTDQARDTLFDALDLANKEKNRAALGDIFQRLAWVSMDRGEAQIAETFCRDALSIYFELENDDRIGQAFYDLGVTFLIRDQRREALRYYQLALNKLAITNTKSRFCAHVASANVHLHYGQDDEALQALESSLQYEPDAPLLTVRALECKARIFERQGKLSAAADTALHLADGCIKEARWLDAALYVNWGLDYRVRASEQEQVLAEAKRYFFDLVEELAGNRTACAALMKILRVAIETEGTITRRLIAEVRADLLAAREDPPARVEA